MKARAGFSVEARAGAPCVRLQGDWTLAALPAPLAALEQQLAELHRRGASWDLRDVGRLDSTAALLLWRIWERRFPDALAVTDAHRHVLERAAAVPRPHVAPRRRDPWAPVVLTGAQVLRAGRHLRDFIALLGQIGIDLIYVLRHPRQAPLRELSATIYKSGAMALPVTALVGFLIGVVLSYLSSLQLRTFGADVYIVNILGISIIRELGPVLVAVLVAGRSGSAMTAQIGVMRVTEEVDALATMGVSRTVRLVLPKVIALAVVMPLLVVWCSAAALLGGMVSAHLQLELTYAFFINTLPKAVPLPNVWIGLSKGVAFGVMIALVACHFGLRVKPNTESLSNRTTSSVVSAITVVILVDAVFAIFTRHVGLP